LKNTLELVKSQSNMIEQKNSEINHLEEKIIKMRGNLCVMVRIRDSIPIKNISDNTINLNTNLKDKNKENEFLQVENKKIILNR